LVGQSQRQHSRGIILFTLDMLQGGSTAGVFDTEFLSQLIEISTSVAVLLTLLELH
jgi:hypothetical protein